MVHMMLPVMGHMLEILLAAATIIIVMIWVALRLKRADQIIAEWACDKDFRLISTQGPNSFGSPFRWRSSLLQLVYYVTVKDIEGRERSAWLRLGNWSSGLISPEIEVEWEKTGNASPLMGTARGRSID